MATKSVSELRKDLVSGDWIVIATGRAKRPEQFLQQKKKVIAAPKSKCAFENPQAAGNADPLLVYGKGTVRHPTKKNDWFLQVIPNKYPAFSQTGSKCPPPQRSQGPYKWMEGIGSHEVLITRDHVRHMGKMTAQEVFMVVHAYYERYMILKNDACSKYISIFHNHGKSAGASIAHPHSQIVAIPVVPPDVGNSLRGSKEYFHNNGKCVHCLMIEHEQKQKIRVVYENKKFVVFCPYVSRTAFEMRIFPKHHQAYFEEISQEGIELLADALRNALAKTTVGLGDPDYNFFLHTAPIEDGHFDHYHWHFEVLPKTVTWAGFELGTGIEISSITPEVAAKFLRKIKVK
jgi:UDPglucose--hexose-1-phosphate uridylyltransferase